MTTLTTVGLGTLAACLLLLLLGELFLKLSFLLGCIAAGVFVINWLVERG